MISKQSPHFRLHSERECYCRYPAAESVQSMSDNLGTVKKRGGISGDYAFGSLRAPFFWL